MDPYRLPRTVVPSRYDLRLEPDLAASTFRGEEIITLTVRETTAEVVLNASELETVEAALENGTSKRTARVRLEPETERCWLSFSEPLEPGTWRLRLMFRGTLNDKLRGFYRSAYKTDTGEVRPLAATQFEATDARRAFPCWDEPDFKAVFASTLVIAETLTAVSNTSVASEQV